MAGAQFRPRVSWPKNDHLLAAERFGVRVPAGVTSTNVRTPNFVHANEMMQLARDKATPPSGPLIMTEGLVTRDLKVTFANPAAQWRQSPMPGTRDTSHGPYQFQFAGGEVFLDLALGIYIQKTGEPDPKDDVSVQIFAVLYEHELLHVLDETEIINRWLIPSLNSEPTILRYLIQAQPYNYGTPGQGQSAAQLDFQKYFGSRMETAIFNVWATETNRRKSLRDSAAEYRKVQEKVDELRIRQINRPHR
jgi:hypothetical protein